MQQHLTSTEVTVTKLITSNDPNSVSYNIKLSEKATKILNPEFDAELLKLIKKHINQKIQLP